MEPGIYLAVDTAYEIGRAVLFSKEGVLFEVEMTLKLDHAKDICGAIDQALAYCETHQLKLDVLFCGLGPGSFVGIRIALSTLLGFSTGSNIPLMGFCSHEALLRSKSDCFIYMKASGDLGYLSGFSLKDGQISMSLPTVVVPIGELSSRLPENASLLSDQPEKLALAAQKITGPTAQGIFAACRSKLGAIADQKAFIKPNYVKPPSVTLPKAK